MTEELKGPLSEANVERVFRKRYEIFRGEDSDWPPHEELDPYLRRYLISQVHQTIKASGAPEACEALEEAIPDFEDFIMSFNDGSDDQQIAIKLYEKVQDALKALGGGE